MAELVHSSATGMRPVPEPVYLVAGVGTCREGGTCRQGGGGSGPAHVRGRTTSGMWLHLHASCIDGANAPRGSVAVVIAPARAPDLAPLIALAYRVTAREQDVLQFTARGYTTAEMAEQPGISQAHGPRPRQGPVHQGRPTQPDRLVARVFADHYFERLKADAEVVSDVALDAPASR